MIDAVDETLTADEMLMGASFVTPAAYLGWGGKRQIQPACLRAFAAYLEPSCIRWRMTNK